MTVDMVDIRRRYRLLVTYDNRFAANLCGIVQGLNGLKVMQFPPEK